VSEPRTFDVRLWVTVDPPGPALAAFFADVRQLAERHDGIEVRWIGERRDRHGRPRVRVHPPPRFGDAGDEGAR
jgi:hypothetical protein